MSDHGEEEENDEPISLGIRQPSFSSLVGIPVPKGFDGVPLDEISEENDGTANPVVVFDEKTYSEMKHESTGKSEEKEEEDEQDNGGHISMGVRQPSYSELGPVNVLKGASPTKLPTVTDEDVVTDLPPIRNATPMKRQSSYSIFVDPTQLNKNQSQQFVYQKLVEVQKEDVTPVKRPKTITEGLHLGTSGTLFTSNHQLKVEMPIEFDEPDPEYIDEQEEFYEEDQAQTNRSSKSSVRLPPDYQLDLRQIRQNQGYDSEQGSSRIPERLAALIDEPKESLTYLALCNVPIEGYNPRKVQRVLRKLNKYLKQCINKGYIDESEYVQEIINRTKEGLASFESEKKMQTEEEAGARLAQVQKEYDSVVAKHDQIEANLEAEREMALEELKDIFEDDLIMIDEEWSSSRKQTQFNKPSPKLLELRRQSMRLLKAKQFDDAAYVTKQVEALEAKEIQEASDKMQKAYHAAIERRREKYRNDQNTLNQTYDSRLVFAKKRRAVELMPYERRVAIAETRENEVKVQTVKAKKAKLDKSVKISTRDISTEQKQRPDVVIAKSQPLKLPQLVLEDRASRPSTRTGSRAPSRATNRASPMRAQSPLYRTAPVGRVRQ